MEKKRYRNHFDTLGIRDMVAVGAITPDSFRLWIRTEKPGSLAVRWRKYGDSGLFSQRTVTIFPENRRDNTVGITITGEDNPLAPLTRYEYRVLREIDEKVVGEGTVETAPADAATTPGRFSFAVMSCNQPFAPDGGVNENANLMLSAVRECLEEHDAKFVLMIGDQMYADMPRLFSLFHPDYFKRISPSGEKSILDCTPAQVRRLYQKRYRQFWDLPGWYEIHRRFPSYMMWDDHDIVDNWGSVPSHQKLRWRGLMEGARRAFMDYQGSLSLENTMVLPDDFDFCIRYGTVAVYTLDIRSNRRSGKNGRICLPEHILRLRQFMDRNADAQALFVVLTVPLLHLPKMVAKAAARFLPEQEDFSDLWSTGAHIFDRDRLLRLLRRNRKANPHQFLGILSGDIHTGCAHRIRFGNSGTYQFISSAVTHGCGPFMQLGSKLLIRANRTFETYDKDLRGRIKLLENAGPGENPYGGLNIGIVEVSKSDGGSRSRVRFHLYGHRGPRPFCAYRSKWL